eukprot:7916380-Pyramimonas_sp.AAC.1
MFCEAPTTRMPKSTDMFSWRLPDSSLPNDVPATLISRTLLARSSTNPVSAICWMSSESQGGIHFNGAIPAI